MSAIIDALITDRTAADVAVWHALRAKIHNDGGYSKLTGNEKHLWDSVLKGSYDHLDLNRVGAALIHLKIRIQECGHIINITPRTDWSMMDEMSSGEMEYYRSCVAAVREKFAQLKSTPETPATMAGLSCRSANDIEKILAETDALITRMARNIDLGWALGLAHTGLYGGI